MRLELSSRSRVLVELRATGVLKIVAHDPVLVAHPQPATIDLGREPFDAPVSARFVVRDIEVPADLGASDREKMRENMLSREVLDAARSQSIDLQARYVGTLEAGHLSGQLVVRGSPRPIALHLRSRPEGADVATGTWEGSLSDLGIKPFRALLGAIRLQDWIRVRVEARLAKAAPLEAE